jgi:hypothetical protein
MMTTAMINPSKILLAVLSCHALRHYEQSIRDTWAKDIPEGVDYRFFLGLPHANPEQDEVFLSVGDTLQDLTHKTVAVCAWAMAQGYEYLFKGDLDTLVRPLGLLQSDFRAWDWVGGQNSFFASGGAGYTLSRRAMQAVVDHPVEPGPAEDVNTAHALLSQGIQLHHDPRFLFIPGQVMDDSTITCHLSSVKAWGAKAIPQEMYQAWADQKEKNYKTYTEPKARSLRWKGRIR